MIGRLSFGMRIWSSTLAMRLAACELRRARSFELETLAVHETGKSRPNRNACPSGLRARFWLVLTGQCDAVSPSGGGHSIAAGRAGIRGTDHHLLRGVVSRGAQ